MTSTLVVIVDDVVAGTITRLPQGRLRFEYDDSYREQSEATPLSLSMPIEVPSHGDHSVTPWLWGLLPDNEAVLARWGRQFHVSTSSPFALLSTPVGEDCAGAVRFAPPAEVSRVLERPGRVDWLTDEEVAQRLRDLRADSTTWLGRSFNGRFSLAGAQAKTALLLRDGRWGVPLGSTATTHILKPAITGLDDHDLNEHLCLDAARRTGLLVRVHGSSRSRRSAPSWWTATTGRSAPATSSASIRRTCARRSAYRRPANTRTRADQGRPRSPPFSGGPCRHRAADAAIAQFADALIWNWLIAGTDAHAKNYSLLLAGNQVRLAPLYDIASALPYGTHERKLRMAMKIGGDYRVVPERNTWPEAARDLGVDPGALVDRIHDLAVRIPDAFADAAGTPGVAALRQPLPDRLVGLVAERASRCLRTLDGPGTP